MFSISLSTALVIFEQLSLFSLFFQFEFLIERSFLLIFQHIIDELDNDLFEHHDMPTSLTIHIYLNRPPYDSNLELGIIERDMRRLLYHFLPLSIYELFELFTVEIHFEMSNPYRVERVQIVERPIVI